KEDAIKGFAASQDRILAMAKAYELLLGSEYMSEVIVGKYIESLAEQLKYNYDIHHKVKISYSLDELTISIEILDRLGLVLNEIITNAIKYAFEGREVGNIHIELKETEKHVVIKISDDGIGMPENIDINDPETLGLSIVDMITQQLQGTLSLDRKNGTSFTLEIPKKIVE
ncbi:MAG: ATP-binding protein, partial [Candidatus Celaenobacter polaris]|nr:ATP-binding protein [Candidatus Celaenobacter polaris]